MQRETILYSPKHDQFVVIWPSPDRADCSLFESEGELNSTIKLAALFNIGLNDVDDFVFMGYV